jgi:hypothetical protein
MLRKIIVALVMALMPSIAESQSSPGLNFGDVPTAMQWNLFFSQKMDYTGSPAITAAGGNFTGKVNFAASGTGTAGMNCGVGTAPSSPVDGDIWCTTVGMFVQINGGTVGPLGSGGAGVLAVSGGGTGVATLAAGGVVIGNGTSPVSVYARSGSGTTIATASGSLTSGHCVSINGTGDFVDAGGACTTGGGGGTVASSTIGQVAVYTAATTVTGIAACNNGYYGTNGSGTVSCITTLNATLSATITALGTVASGTWQGSVVAGQYGGTGAANTGLTISLGGNLATAGGAITLTAIGATNVTLPTSGTLMNQSGTSGGIPYYNTSTTVQSSSALTANLPLFGGGAGAAPFSGTRLGNTTKAQMANATTSPVTGDCVSYDANGNTQDSGQPCGSANAAPVLLATLTASSSTSLTDVGAPGCSSGCFTSTYPTYTIRIVNLVAAVPGAAVICQIQAYSSATYQNSGYISQFSLSGVVGATNPTAFIPCSASSSLGANGNGSPGVSGQYTVQNPSASIKSTWLGAVGNVTGSTGSPTVVTGQAFGWWNTAAIVTGFRIFFGTSVGVPTTSGIASGTVEVYGNP